MASLVSLWTSLSSVPHAGCVLQPCIPPPADDGFRWTSKYLRTNPKIREIVDTILELAYMPPNRALSVGKVFVSITNCPEAETYLSNKTLVVKICGAYGWSFEFMVRAQYHRFSNLPRTFLTCSCFLFVARLVMFESMSAGSTIMRLLHVPEVQPMRVRARQLVCAVRNPQGPVRCLHGGGLLPTPCQHPVPAVQPSHLPEQTLLTFRGYLY